MATAGEPDWLQVEEMAELRSDEEGYQGAWFAVKIIRLFPAKGQAAVEYRDFVESNEPGSKRCKEFARKDHLRPVPPALPQRKSWNVRDAVETLHKDAWWIGYIKDYNARGDTYRVWFGYGQDELDIPASRIRPRQNFLQPSRDSPNGSWSLARPMQNPALWDRTEKPPVAKRPAAPTQPRVTVPAPHVGDASDDSWDEQKERQHKKKPRLQSKSRSAPATAEVAPKKIRFVKFPKTLTIAHALPAINPPPKPSEQTIVCLTPGSSPPVADSPFQDSAVSPGSDSQAQKPLANPEASPPTRSSSNSSSNPGSESSHSSSSGDDDDVCVQSGDGDHSTEEHDSIHSLMSNRIFPDFSNGERSSHNMKVYSDLLGCFRNDSKGLLDLKRHDILKGIRDELKLPLDFCNKAHCQVFGMPCQDR